MMRAIALPGSGKVTTQLGFGCAYLQPDDAARLLEAAYAAGIRHFDVARSYGRGQTESLVGRFLASKGDDVTVTTKYGIRPPINSPILGTIRTVLRPVVRRLRRSASLNQAINRSITAQYAKAAFDGDDAIRSLKYSLARLRRDRVDLFQMHEAEAADLTDPTLADALQRAVSDGLIGAYGVGGDSSRIPELQARAPGFTNVLQFEWTALDAPIAHPGFTILYRTFSGTAAKAREALAQDAGLANTWSDEIGMDLRVAGTFERLMLRAALDAQPGSIVLISSTKPAHIAANVATASDPTLPEAAARLVAKIRSAQSLLGGDREAE